jgi:hypothetical protein
MVRRRRLTLSGRLILFIPWIVLTLLSGGAHNHAELTLESPDCSSPPGVPCVPHLTTGNHRPAVSAETTVHGSPTPCLACLWQITAHSDAPAEAPAARTDDVTPVAVVAAAPPVVAARPLPDARAPPRA